MKRIEKLNIAVKIQTSILELHYPVFKHSTEYSL